MRNTAAKLAMAWLMGAGLALVGCGGDDDGGASTVDVTGTWTGTIQKENDAGTGTMILVQNGTDVTGTETDTWSQRAGVTGRVTGTVDGHSVSLTVVDESVSQISAQVSGDTMTCTWTNNDGDSGTAEFERQ